MALMSVFQSSRRIAGNRFAWVSASTMLLAAGMMSAEAQAARFKIANIHYETNASACDMGIQIAFDTEGIVNGAIKYPDGRPIYDVHTHAGMRGLGGQAEGFVEGIEPQIIELLTALGCTVSTEEGLVPLADLLAAFPDGNYIFTGQTKDGKELLDHDRLTHHIPAGPKITAPAKFSVVPDAPLMIRWQPVTGPIIPALGPVNITGYHVIVYETGAEALPQLDVDLPPSETSLKVPAQFLTPNKHYEIEVLATEESGNQTFTEGFFCTVGVARCTE
jgi:hypothetical protein